MLKHALDSSELRALSIPTSLHFMLGVELDLFASSVEAQGKPLNVKFPPLAPFFEKLLGSVAKRFGLNVMPSKTVKGQSWVTGVATLPLLRYTDFIPGTLHLDEIFTRFNVKPVEQVLPLLPGEVLPDGCDLATEHNFEAHAIPYKTFSATGEAEETHSGLGHYCMLELGLNLATHAHLIAFSIRSGKELEKTVRKFQGFSGWSKFDLRWEDESSKTAGIIVLPSVADAVELLEAYEDEDESSEENRLPFVLEPVAPTVFIPYMEDTQVKKMRSSNWNTATTFWEQGGPKSVDRFSVVVSNFSERVGLNDIVKLFDKDKYFEAVLFVDESPHRRRRMLLQLVDKQAARDVLDMDAKHYHGAPLRISVAPPFVNRSRYGIELASAKGNGKQPDRLPSPGLKGMNVTAKEFVPKFALGGSVMGAGAPPPAAPPSYAETQPPGYAPPSYDQAPPGYEVATTPGQHPAPPPPPPPPGPPPTTSPGNMGPVSGPPGYFQSPPSYGAPQQVSSPPMYAGDNRSFGNSFSNAPPAMNLPPPG